MIDESRKQELLRLAEEARNHAYCPYSQYAVGAALLTGSGRIYQGCNIENAAYSPGVCAERTAFFRAVYDGEKRFEAIAIMGSGETPAFPCGVCRQVMAEFCENGFLIITSNRDASIVVTETLENMLPNSFGPKDLL